MSLNDPAIAIGISLIIALVGFLLILVGLMFPIAWLLWSRLAHRP